MSAQSPASSSCCKDALSVIEVADSRFFGFVRKVASKSEALKLQQTLRIQNPTAAHIPLAWREGRDEEFDEDGEPSDSTGPVMLGEIPESGYAVVVVRYFKKQLLGVACGRLSQCYQACVKLALHRFLHGKCEPLVREFLDPPSFSLYGLAAGDCELVLDILPPSVKVDIFNRIKAELRFDGFQGSLGEVLPRLQNLQADLSSSTIPVYRYPGNYRGNEWETFQWSPTSLQIKEAVENNLLLPQIMNHCVTNYYRDGEDFIDHHSDKDLDLNQEGVIVSVSLGDERVMELKLRDSPHDIFRVTLPHGSMLVIGPLTNKLFTHSILKKPASRD